MALSDEQIVLTARQIGGLFDDLAVHYQSDDIVRFARAIEAEVRKDDEALIRQMESALSWSSPLPTWQPPKHGGSGMGLRVRWLANPWRG